MQLSPAILDLCLKTKLGQGNHMIIERSSFSQSSVFKGLVRTHPDIFESATFSFRIQKFPRPQVACSWRADSKISGFAAEFAGCAWGEAVSGKKKLRIQNEMPAFSNFSGLRSVF